MRNFDFNEFHRGPILLTRERYGESDKQALAFIMTERSRVDQEYEEGQEAVRIALRDVKVHSVGHAPGHKPWRDELDEIAAKAEQKFSELDGMKQKRLRREMETRLREAA